MAWSISIEAATNRLRLGVTREECPAVLDYITGKGVAAIVPGVSGHLTRVARTPRTPRSRVFQLRRSGSRAQRQVGAKFGLYPFHQNRVADDGEMIDRLAPRGAIL